MRRVGVIDIGTNSMRLMIAHMQGDKIVSSYKTIETTRLGQGIDKNGFINLETFERNYRALEVFKGLAQKELVDDLIVFGTSALRDAKNSAEFVNKVQDNLGISIDILSGKEEAEIGFKGALKDIGGEVLVIDIGGGSTELIFGDEGKGVEESYSLDMGALRMTEIYIKNHPVTKEELRAMDEGIHRILATISPELLLGRTKRVIGIGGTITTLSAIHLGLKIYDREKIHLSELAIQDIESIHERLGELSLEKRKKVPGLHPGRADIIIAGISILKCIMKSLGIQDILVSENDNLEGMLYNYLEKNKNN